MRALPLVALALGFLVVYVFVPPIPARMADYVSLAILAGFDAIIGGARARLEQQFDAAIFVSGFFANMVLAVVLAYLGDKLGVDLYLAVVVALGIRMFANLGRIRGRIVTLRLQARQARSSATPE